MDAGGQPQVFQYYGVGLGDAEQQRLLEKYLARQAQPRRGCDGIRRPFGLILPRVLMHSPANGRIVGVSATTRIHYMSDD